MQFVRVEPGTFTMGVGATPLPDELSNGWVALQNGDFDEHPNHPVTITQPFHAGVYEVTNAQYEQFDPAHSALRGKLGFSTADDEAVVFVSWNDANVFCDWLSAREGLPYRLPTEAEWEYACRAGTTTHFFTGDSLPAAYHKNQESTWYPDPEKSEPDDVVSLLVGGTAPNAWGLYDVHGNVEEWCHDWYNDIYYSVSPYSNPTGPTTGDQRVLRGGDWELNPDSCRTSSRVGWTPSGRAHPDGFRCALGLP